MSPSRLPWAPLVYILALAMSRIALLPLGQWRVIVFFYSLPPEYWDLNLVQATLNAEDSTLVLVFFGPAVPAAFKCLLLPYGWLCGEAYHHGGSYTISFFFRLGLAFRPAWAAMSDQPPPFRFGCLVKMV